MKEIYSPELTELVVRVCQWNINAYIFFSNLLIDVQDKTKQDQIANMLAYGKDNNQVVLNYLTNKEKGETIN